MTYESMYCFFTRSKSHRNFFMHYLFTLLARRFFLHLMEIIGVMLFKPNIVFTLKPSIEKGLSKLHRLVKTNILKKDCYSHWEFDHFYNLYFNLT